MSGRIYLLRDNHELVPMDEKPYDAEWLLQKLLADYPDLLAGEQFDPDEPRRWLLVKRESGIPKAEGGGLHWSVDHLFVDQDGIPTLVEVKRAANTQIRRDVVGQMLDYAANATAYWSVEHVRELFEQQVAASGRDPGLALSEFLGSDSEADQFWTQVKTNLQAGRVRLVFVADEIPPELKRIVEFLNSQMDPAEVLALEVRQFVGATMKTLVPKVIGLTAAAGKKKGEGVSWDEPSFLERIASRRGEAEAAVARRILKWADDQGLTISWGKGKGNGSFSPKLEAGGDRHNMFSAWTDGGIQIQFGSMHSPPFSEPNHRAELQSRLNAIPGVAIPDSAVSLQWPVVRLFRLLTSEALQVFLGAWDWYIDTVKAFALSQGGGPSVDSGIP